VDRGNSLESGRLLLLAAAARLSWGSREEQRHQEVLGGRQQGDHGLVEGILVLLEPVSDVVGHGAGVVVELEVSLEGKVRGGAMSHRVGVRENTLGAVYSYR